MKYFFLKVLRFTISFFIFFIIFDILFSISSICSCQNILEIFIFLFYVLEILSKNFGKSWNVFKKNRHLKSKFLHKFHRVLFFFYSFSILVIFFPISPIQTCQKILNIFVLLYCTDSRFYQRILENSSIFIKKNRDILNTKHFQNSIVYYLHF